MSSMLPESVAVKSWRKEVRANVEAKNTLFVMPGLEWEVSSVLERKYECNGGTTEWTHDMSRLNKSNGVVYFGPDVSMDYTDHKNKWRGVDMPLTDETVRVYLNLEGANSRFSTCTRDPKCIRYFNWIVSYHPWADIRLKYFEYVRHFSKAFLEKDGSLKPWDFKTMMANKTPGHLIAWITTACEVWGRTHFMERFMMIADVHSYGKCMQNRNLPPDGQREDDGAVGVKLQIISTYKFYLALENTNCPYYITEKVYHCLMAGVIPVYMGHPTNHALLPPGSFIDVRNFKTQEKLLDYLNYLDKNDQEYAKYFEWRREPQALLQWAEMYKGGSTYGSTPCDLHNKYLAHMTESGLPSKQLPTVKVPEDDMLCFDDYDDYI
eukprot:gene10316-12028_t